MTTTMMMMMTEWIRLTSK